MSEIDILVVEDEALIAMDIEMTLNEAGYGPVSVQRDVDGAVARIKSSKPALALLDFNLGKGATSLPVAQELHAVGVPFIFLTGYTEATVALPEEFGDVRRLAKPFNGEQLVEVVGQMLART